MIFGQLIGLLTNKNVQRFLGDMKKNRENNDFSSISAKASEGILQFPVIISNLVDYENAILIMKGCERTYANFIQTIVSMNSDMSDMDVNTISAYLRKFHTNDSSATTDSTAEYSKARLGDRLAPIRGKNADGSKYKAKNLGHDMHLESAMTMPFTVNDPKSKVTFECELYYPKNNPFASKMKDIMKPYLEDFCLTKLNDLYHPADIKDAHFTIPMFEATADDNKDAYNKYLEDKGIKSKDLPYNEYLKNQRKLDNDSVLPGGYDVKLEPNEVKKSNEMQPTMIRLTVKRLDADARQTVEYNFLVGIKCSLHLVKSDEFINNLVDACEYKGKLFRFIKWYSGEIDFLKDFVLNMDQFTKDIKRNAAGQSHWWDALKRRAREAKISRVETDRLLPNATFVFTKAEVDYLKANYGYDCMDWKIAKRLMEEYCLLGYIVLDMASEVAYILYDGQKDFQELTFKSMERDNAQSERNFKDMMRLAKKM